jgi:hypothetical protein
MTDANAFRYEEEEDVGSVTFVALSSIAKPQASPRQRENFDIESSATGKQQQCDAQRAWYPKPAPLVSNTTGYSTVVLKACS